MGYKALRRLDETKLSNDFIRTMWDIKNNPNKVWLLSLGGFYPNHVGYKVELAMLGIDFRKSFIRTMWDIKINKKVTTTIPSTGFIRTMWDIKYRKAVTDERRKKKLKFNIH